MVSIKGEKMTLKEVIEHGFDKFCNGQCDSISILDAEGETIKVVSLDQLKTIEEKYLNARFVSIGSSSLKPTRARIRIDYLE